MLLESTAGSTLRMAHDICQGVGPRLFPSPFSHKMHRLLVGNVNSECGILGRRWCREPGGMRALSSVLFLPDGQGRGLVLLNHRSQVNSGRKDELGESWVSSGNSCRSRRWGSSCSCSRSQSSKVFDVDSGGEFLASPAAGGDIGDEVQNWDKFNTLFQQCSPEQNLRNGVGPGNASSSSLEKGKGNGGDSYMGGHGREGVAFSENGKLGEFLDVEMPRREGNRGSEEQQRRAGRKFKDEEEELFEDTSWNWVDDFWREGDEVANRNVYSNRRQASGGEGVDGGEASGRMTSDRRGSNSEIGRDKQDLIRRRLHAMEQEQKERESLEAKGGMNFRTKDRDVLSPSGWKAIRKVDNSLARFPDGPVMTRSSMIAKQVISQDSAMSLGFVVQMWTDVQTWKVVAVEVRPSMLFGLVDAILLQNLSQVGDVILVPNEDVLEGELDWTGCEPLVGFDIFTESALYLGKVRDFDFNVENGGVLALEFDSFGVPLIPASVVSTFSLPIGEIVEVGEECLLVRTGAEKRMQVLTKGLWGKFSGDRTQPKGGKVDDRLVLKSVRRRPSQTDMSKQQLSRAEFSRAQEVADMYTSNRRYSGSNGRDSFTEELGPDSSNNPFARREQARVRSSNDRRSRNTRARDTVQRDDEEFE